MDRTKLPSEVDRKHAERAESRHRVRTYRDKWTTSKERNTDNCGELITLPGKK